MSLIHEALQALEAMKAEFRALDLPCGSKAYAQANEVSYRLRAALADQPAAAPQPVAQTYTLGQWFQADTVDELQAFYLARLPAIRQAAQAHGYAIGLHGSTRRDLDLIAAAWRDGASDADTLAHAIAHAACGIDRAGAYEWERKPVGRLATSIPICWTAWHGQPGAGHIDLSVTPAAAPAGVVGEPPTHEALTDAISEALQGTYHCLRVWSAWSVGTMGEDDFSPVDESDTPANIADLVMRLYTAPPARQALPQSEVDAIINASREADEGPTGLVRRTERAHGIGAV